MIYLVIFIWVMAGFNLFQSMDLNLAGKGFGAYFILFLFLVFAPCIIVSQVILNLADWISGGDNNLNV